MLHFNSHMSSASCICLNMALPDEVFPSHTEGGRKCLGAVSMCNRAAVKK